MTNSAMPDLQAPTSRVAWAIHIAAPGVDDDTINEMIRIFRAEAPEGVA